MSEACKNFVKHERKADQLKETQLKSPYEREERRFERRVDRASRHGIPAPVVAFRFIAQSYSRALKAAAVNPKI
jgi:hypothetical protein